MGFLLTFLFRRGNLDYMAGKKRPNNYWNKDRVKEEALKYGRPSDFQRESKGAYLAALKDKYLDEICSHMTIKTYWTDEMLHNEALKYNSRSAFREGNDVAYTLAHERKISDKICSHMKYLLTYWDEKSVQGEALKYNTYSDFQKKSPRAYTAARRLNILDKVCSHMKKLRTYWTDEMLAEEALKYTNRTEFQNKGGSAYALALNRKIVDKICEHMKFLGAVSGAEKEVCEFIKTYYPDTLSNSKKVIPPLELDIYIPEISLAIEYCGLYWHSQDKKEKNYHINKQKICNSKDIRLITIFEDEWLERQDQVKGYLKSVLNKNEIKIFARKTEIKEVPKKEARQFLEKYHIQGATNFEIAFGLYYNNELLSVVTGGAHHRQGHGETFVLNRLAFKTNVSVAGGSSKLLKHLINYAKSTGFKKLLSWSDNRWSQGRVYESIGFKLEDEHGPDYSYVKGQTRVSKQSCQKKLLIKKGANGTMDNTEYELALTLGLIRIWDCGKKAWSMAL